MLIHLCEKKGNIFVTETPIVICIPLIIHTIEIHFYWVYNSHIWDYYYLFKLTRETILISLPMYLVDLK